MNNKNIKHQRIPDFEFNSIMENENNDNNSKVEKRLNMQEKGHVVNVEISQNFDKNTDQRTKGKKKKCLCWMTLFILIIISVGLAIIIPSVYKIRTNNDSSSGDVQNLINSNTNTTFIFETHDYFLVDKKSRKNKVFTQGLFFDTESTLIESGGLYGESKLRRFELKSPDENLFEYDLDLKYFAEGACLYQNKFVLQLTWKERVM